MLLKKNLKSFNAFDEPHGFVPRGPPAPGAWVGALVDRPDRGALDLLPLGPLGWGVLGQELLETGLPSGVHQALELLRSESLELAKVVSIRNHRGCQMWKLHRYYLKEIGVNGLLTFVVLFGIALLSLLF